MKKRQFIKSLGLGLGMAPVLGFTHTTKNHIEPEILLPKKLKPGDKVGLISPSAATADRMEFTFAREALEALGLKVVEGRYLSGRRGHLAGRPMPEGCRLNESFGLNIYKAVVCIPARSLALLKA